MQDATVDATKRRVEQQAAALRDEAVCACSSAPHSSGW
jgi:hypothetical protein